MKLKESSSLEGCLHLPHIDNFRFWELRRREKGEIPFLKFIAAKIRRFPKI
uniref:Uncharacterized protein n=1 Tax=Helianthus annuus TaxID=4232 RepID=A0A251VM46_HELAN